MTKCQEKIFKCFRHFILWPIHQWQIISSNCSVLSKIPNWDSINGIVFIFQSNYCYHICVIKMFDEPSFELDFIINYYVLHKRWNRHLNYLINSETTQDNKEYRMKWEWHWIFVSMAEAENSFESLNLYPKLEYIPLSKRIRDSSGTTNQFSTCRTWSGCGLNRCYKNSIRGLFYRCDIE